MIDLAARVHKSVAYLCFSNTRVCVLSMAKGAAGDKHKGDLCAICARFKRTTGNAESVSNATSELWLRQDKAYSMLYTAIARTTRNN